MKISMALKLQDSSSEQNHEILRPFLVEVSADGDNLCTHDRCVWASISPLRRGVLFPINDRNKMTNTPAFSIAVYCKHKLTCVASLIAQTKEKVD